MTLRALISSAFLFAASTSLVLAASAEDYLKEKQQAVSDIGKALAAGPVERADKLDQQALLKLQETLRTLIGPVQLKGFAGDGKISLETLEKGEEGWGGLDGLAYTSTSGDRHLIVTRKPLLQAWLATFEAEVKMPADLPSAVANDSYYSGAFNDGTSVYKYADLPVKVAKADTVAKAILFRQSQDQAAPRPPDQIAVTVIQGDRAYLLWQKTTARDIAECKNAYKPGISEEGEFEQCYARKLPAQSGYDALLKQAQAMADELISAPQ
ncbi:hypothetical protein [Bordetella sp. N]|uniref:hypothetical protein n=1 Tax=Bordetella sp. N TaxID=1746199 RepID=UPI00070B7C58|nr:hypothetical protein [Bordetella sp. N]ALM82091.1 hypothetical protein ASB57_03125 [Bordetella sp. N]